MGGIERLKDRDKVGIWVFDLEKKQHLEKDVREEVPKDEREKEADSAALHQSHPGWLTKNNGSPVWLSVSAMPSSPLFSSNPFEYPTPTTVNSGSENQAKL